MIRSHQAFGGIAQTFGMAGFRLQPFQISIGIGAIDGNHARRATFQVEALADIQQFLSVAPPFCPQIRRHVFRRDKACRHAGVGSRNVIGLHQAPGQFHIGNDFHLSGLVPDDPVHHLGQVLNARGAIDLGQHHDIRASGQDCGQIIDAIAGQGIDPNGSHRACLAPGRKQFRRQGTGCRAMGRACEILKFQDNHIRA